MSHLIGSVVWYGGRHCAHGGVFVICSVADDDEADTIQPLLRPRRRLCRSLRRRWRGRYEFIQFAPAAASWSFSMSSMTNTIRIQPCCALSGVFFVCSVVDGNEANTIQSCWQPTWSYFHRIAAVRQSTPINIYSLTLIVIGSALVIHRAFTLIISDVPPYASLWFW